MLIKLSTFYCIYKFDFRKQYSTLCQMQITYNVLITAKKKNEFENYLYHISLIKINNDQQVKQHGIKKNITMKFFINASFNDWNFAKLKKLKEKKRTKSNVKED